MCDTVCAQISSHLKGAANVLWVSFLSDCLGTRKVACRDLLCNAHSLTGSFKYQYASVWRRDCSKGRPKIAVLLQEGGFRLLDHCTKEC